MATGEEDTVAMSREPGGSGPVLVSEDPQHKTDLPGTTRTRKKVTFDLDLQVRTIPNRIPLYERRPAYNPASHAYARSNQAVAFVPRPLDIRTRDKYLIGAAHLSAKRIIDLFSVPNGHPGYPVPPKGQHLRPGQSGYRRQNQGYGASGGAGNSANRHPAYTYAGLKSSKLSRAAANLKQITAALGEHFDSTVYQEWDTSKSPTGRSVTSASSAGTHRDTETVDNTTPGGVSKHAPSQTPSQSFTPTRTRPYLPYRQQLNPHPEPQPNPSHDSESESNVTVSSLLDRSRSSSYPGTIPSSRRIPTVNTEQIPLKDKHLVITKAPATLQKSDTRRRSDTGAYSGGERFRRVPSARDRERSDRAPSRCSTIDTYVISENGESKNTPSTMNRIGSARSNNGLRKAMPTSTKSRSVAWEGAELSVTEPALTANALRTSKTDHNTTTGSNWHVSSKQINL